MYMHESSRESSLKAALRGVVAGVVAAALLWLGLENSAHDIAFVLPHGLQLLGWVVSKGLQYIFHKLVDIKALGAAHGAAPPLANRYAQGTEEGEVANVEVWRLRRLPDDLDERFTTLALATRLCQLLRGGLCTGRRRRPLSRPCLWAAALLGPSSSLSALP